MSRLATIELTTHESLLLRCIAATSDVAQLRRDFAAIGTDWFAFWELAGRQHVRPLVAHRLASNQLLARLMPDAQAEIIATRLDTTAQNLANRTELVATTKLLRELNIPVVPLKGVSLAERVFGSLGARRCGDIDMLVPEEDWELAYHALISRGYQPVSSPNPGVLSHPFHGVPLTRTVDGRKYVVELHHQLTDPSFADIEHATLWQNLLSADEREDWAFELPAEELLVFLAFHLAKHDEGALRLLADIDHLIAREGTAIDWGRIVRLAASWRVESLLYFALDASASLFATPVPQSVIRKLRPAMWKRHAVLFLAGPRAILRPPATEHLRVSRFRLAYCLMLASTGRVLRSYWHYMLAPARACAGQPVSRLGHVSRQAVDGTARTVLALGSALHDCLRFRSRQWSWPR